MRLFVPKFTLHVKMIILRDN
jgi:LCP family protein required for cell wall assembly